jgi:phage portal protein BeeE
MRDMAQAFNEARATNQTAFISQELDYEATTATPDKMLLVESREFQAKELSRYANVPAYLLGIDVGGYTYQNASQAKQDLYLFAAKNYIEVFNQTLSANNVLPNGTYVCLDIESYLEEMIADGVYVEETVSPTPNQTNPTTED